MVKKKIILWSLIPTAVVFSATAISCNAIDDNLPGADSLKKTSEYDWTVLEKRVNRPNYKGDNYKPGSFKFAYKHDNGPSRKSLYSQLKEKSDLNEIRLLLQRELKFTSTWTAPHYTNNFHTHDKTSNPLNYDPTVGKFIMKVISKNIINENTMEIKVIFASEIINTREKNQLLPLYMINIDFELKNE